MGFHPLQSFAKEMEGYGTEIYEVGNVYVFHYFQVNLLYLLKRICRAVYQNEIIIMIKKAELNKIAARWPAQVSHPS